MQRLVEIGYVLDRQGLVQSVLPPDLLNHLRRLRLQTEILVLTDNVYHRVARHKPDEDEIDGYDTEDDKNRNKSLRNIDNRDGPHGCQIAL